MVRICIVGCLHGELDKVYQDVARIDKRSSCQTELILCCGDFQSVRNPADLNSMSVPSKFYQMGDFYRYYSEELVAPIPTVFIGGNHESSAYLQELPYGGWVAPNIWYMGYGGVIQFGGLRIAGLSGIYKEYDYQTGHFEHAPYTDSTKRSVYHIRNVDVFRLAQIRRRVDIVLSHDWPRGIYQYGNTEQLLRMKPYFSEEVASNTLGSPPAEQLLCLLRPRYWFSAHLHCKFAALVSHSAPVHQTTRFLALDKCLPSRRYLQFIDIEPDPCVISFASDGELVTTDMASPIIVTTTRSGTSNEVTPRIFLDPEWLCVLKSTNGLNSFSQVPCILPGQQTFHVNTADMCSLWETFGGDFAVPDNFERTEPAYKPNDKVLQGYQNSKKQMTKVNLRQLARESYHDQRVVSNPQTELLCAMLDLTNPNAVFLGQQSYDLVSMTSRIEESSGHESSGINYSTFITSPNASPCSSSSENHKSEEYDPATAVSPIKRVRLYEGTSLESRHSNPEEVILDGIDDEDSNNSDSYDPVIAKSDLPVYHPQPILDTNREDNISRVPVSF